MATWPGSSLSLAISPEYLGADPFEFLLVKRRVLQDVREQCKAEVDIFLEYAGGGGREIL